MGIGICVFGLIVAGIFMCQIINGEYDVDETSKKLGVYIKDGQYRLLSSDLDLGSFITFHEWKYEFKLTSDRRIVIKGHNDSIVWIRAYSGGVDVYYYEDDVCMNYLYSIFRQRTDSNEVERDKVSDERRKRKQNNINL